MWNWKPQCEQNVPSWHYRRLSRVQSSVNSTHSGLMWTDKKMHSSLCCRRRHNSEQCSQTQQMNIVLSYAADEWLSPSGHEALIRGYVQEYVQADVFVCDCSRGQKNITFKSKHVIFSHMHMPSRTNKHIPPVTHKQDIIIPLLQRCSIRTDKSPGDLALPNTLRKSAESHLSSPSIFPHFPCSPSPLLFIFVCRRLPSCLPQLSPEVSGVLSCSLLSVSLSSFFSLTSALSLWLYRLFLNSSEGSSLSPKAFVVSHKNLKFSPFFLPFSISLHLPFPCICWV